MGSNQALVTIANCNDKAGAKWYLGKRVCHIHKAKNTVNNTRFRVSWGKVVNTHGHQGAVRCSFRKNLCPRFMGSTVRVMLYPSKSSGSSGAIKKVIWLDAQPESVENKEMQKMFLSESYQPKKGDKVDGACLNKLFGVNDAKASGNFVCVTSLEAARKAIRSSSSCILLSAGKFVGDKVVDALHDEG